MTALRSASVGGALGGSAALLVMLLARVGGGPPGTLEVVADAVVRLIPAWLFDWGIRTLGPAAKGLLFAVISAGLPVAGALLAGFLTRVGLVRGRHPIVDGAVLGVAALVLGELVVLPLAGAGPAGGSLLSDRAAVHVPLAVASLVYAAVGALWLASHPQRQAPRSAPGTGLVANGAGAAFDHEGQPGLSRRAFVTRTLAFVGLGSLLASGLVVIGRVIPPSRQALPGAVDPPGAEGFGFVRAVTPLPEFYFVSKDWVPMEIDPHAWRLHVSGLVAKPRSWTLDELRELPAQEGFRTLQCISAESITRSELIGNQRWKGVRVRDVLEMAGPDPSAGFIIWHCADGYHESLDLVTAHEDDSWLAYEMGAPGTSLTPEHGRPMRLLVAGRYGMAQPKYITDMILSATDEPGWWVKGGWQTDAPVRTYCRIDLPAADGISDSVLAGRPFTAFGVASSGDRAISAVQVSTDRGETWRDAELEPLGGPIGRLTWVRWRAEMRLDEPGQILFMARAADGQGRWQTDEVAEPFPKGASGYPRVPMRVYASVGEPGGT